MFLAESNVGHKICRPQDLVINTLWAWMAALGVSRYTGIVSPAYGVYRPLDPGQLLPRFADLLLRTPMYAAEYQRRSTGVNSSRLRLYAEYFFRIPIILPPPDEQLAIVRFLDHANRKIDGFIRAKRKLIGLLNEQKQAIIHRAVTRGLDPNAKLKPSGIPWLGEIPAHWELRRLRTLTRRIEQGVSPQATGFLAEGDTWGVLKSGCINHGVFRQTEHKQLSKDFAIDPSIVVKVGDVLISRACGSPKLVGSVGKVKALDYQLILSDKTFRAVFGPFVDTDFMVYAMNGVYYRQQVEQAISGADGMANNLPLSELKSFVFAIPPLAEATEIASKLDAELARFTTAIARTEREITLMQEYRTRLTADIVTGKLDVREAAAKLPEPVAEEAADSEISEEETEPEEAEE
jgi:type I restriction enzyme S subunit